MDSHKAIRLDRYHRHGVIGGAASYAVSTKRDCLKVSRRTILATERSACGEE